MEGLGEGWERKRGLGEMWKRISEGWVWVKTTGKLDGVRKNGNFGVGIYGNYNKKRVLFLVIYTRIFGVLYCYKLLTFSFECCIIIKD